MVNNNIIRVVDSYYFHYYYLESMSISVVIGTICY